MKEERINTDVHEKLASVKEELDNAQSFFNSIQNQLSSLRGMSDNYHKRIMNLQDELDRLEGKDSASKAEVWKKEAAFKKQCGTCVLCRSRSLTGHCCLMIDRLGLSHQRSSDKKACYVGPGDSCKFYRPLCGVQND